MLVASLQENHAGLLKGFTKLFKYLSVSIVRPLSSSICDPIVNKARHCVHGGIVNSLHNKLA
jgi:hypothetical protein